MHYAARVIRRQPEYAIIAILCLGLGTGVNSTVFSLLDGIYLRLLPVPHARGVVSIRRSGDSPMFWREYVGLRGNLRVFSGVAASQARGTFMDVGLANFSVVVETVSANYADVLETKPAAGRWFLPADELPGAEPAVVISVRLWTARFHRERDVIGRTVRIERQWYRVIGVAASDFRGTSPPMDVDAWLPLVTFPIFQAQLRDASAAGPTVALVGRVAPGQTVQAAAAEMAAVDGQAGPLTVGVFRGIVSTGSRRSMRSIAMLLLAVVLVVLLIASVNVANLLLSRAVVRRREMAVRRALGASRSRLVRQCLAESSLLAAGGAAVGIVFGYWTDRALSTWLPASIPESVFRGIYLEMNWRVAGFTAIVAVLCAVFFSLAPALEGSSVDLCSALKTDISLGRTRRWPQRDVYVMAQVTLSLVLLIGAALLLRALERTSHVDPGFATDRRIYIRLFTPEPDFTPDSSTRLFTRLLNEARTLPGVRDATLSFDVLGFMDGECATVDRGSPPTRAAINVVEPNYFQMMHVPLLRGRNFVGYDRPETGRVVIVNETMARRRWPGQDAIGKTLWLGCGGAEPRVRAQVIAVARDSKYGALDEEPRPFFYVSRLQVWWNGFFALIVETSGDPHAITESLIRLARTGGPNLRIYEVKTFDELLTQSLWGIRWQTNLLAAFGLLAMVLSAVGLYGVVAYAAAQRTGEIGIRMALGAQRRDVQWMVLAHALRLTVTGILAGLVVSSALMRLLRSYLYGVEPSDPVAFGAAALAWLLIAVLASYVPARRAARIDPAISLRDQ
jgi:putative ABC transport system permease protein